MRKLADLYIGEQNRTGQMPIVDSENMRKEDEGLVADLMRDSKVISQINNACKNIANMSKSDKEQDVADFRVNLSSAVSSSAAIGVKIVLLKDSDDRYIRITLKSLVSVPAR